MRSVLLSFVPLAPMGSRGRRFYDWYSRSQEGGIEALEDGKPTDLEQDPWGLSGIFVARGRFSSLADEPFAEDDSELGLGLDHDSAAAKAGVPRA